MAIDPKSQPELPEYDGPEPSGNDGVDLDAVAEIAWWNTGTYMYAEDEDAARAADTEAADTN